LSEVIVKNGGGRMLEQPFLMSSALRACARSLGFLMGYYTFVSGSMSIRGTQISVKHSVVIEYACITTADHER